MSSKARKLKSLQSRVFSAVENNSQLLVLLESATSTTQKTVFIKALLTIYPTAFLGFSKMDNPDELFTVFTAWFGSYADSTTLFSGINAALKRRHQYIFENRYKKRQFIHDIGLDWTADAKALFFSKVNSLCGVVGEFSFLF